MSKQKEHKGSLNKKIVQIKGMHCRSCEILIEEEILKVEGVHRVNVSEKKGFAEIFYEGEVPDAHIEDAVCGCGYSLGKNTNGWVSKEQKEK